MNAVIIQIGYKLKHSCFGYLALFVCLSVCPQRNSKMNDLKLFKLGIGNDLGISYMVFGLERLKVMITESISAFFTLITILMHI